MSKFGKTKIPVQKQEQQTNLERYQEEASL